MNVSSYAGGGGGGGGGRRGRRRSLAMEVDPDESGDRPKFGMSKGTRTTPGKIFYCGRFIDQKLLYQVSNLLFVSTTAKDGAFVAAAAP